MIFFSPDFLHFFEELTKNNNTDWFEANRSRYEEHVRQPFTNFVGEMIRRIQRYEPHLNITPSEAIFRIERDTRFAKDKSHYKNNMAANISPQGRFVKNTPGFYFQFGTDKGIIAGGLYALDRDTLARVRSEIAWHGDEFRQLLESDGFKAKYGDLQGEKNKKLPADLKEAYAQQPLIANKQFYYMAEIPAELILHENLADIVIEFYKAAKPLNEFLRRATQMEGKAQQARSHRSK